MANPSTYTGVHSGTELAVCDLEVILYAHDDITRIEELLNKRAVTVEDGFVGRQYEANLTITLTSYQSDRPGKTFQFEVKEMDIAKQFERLELEGQPFEVMKSIETFNDDIVGIHVLLRLSADEFQEFHRLLKPGPINIRRIGIDEAPIVQRFGGALYWSLDQESYPITYKQIVNLYPDDDLDYLSTMASGHTQKALSDMVLALSARYEALLALLVANGQLSQEHAEWLKDETWDQLVSNDRQVMIRSQLEQIGDAELDFDWSFFSK